MNSEERQTKVADLVRRILQEHDRSGVSRHQIVVAVNRELGLHVDHQDMVDTTLKALATKIRRQRFVLKRLK